MILGVPGGRGIRLGWAAGCWPPPWRSALVVAFVTPAAVAALYVRPNEISLERPYIDTHIHATLQRVRAGAQHARDRVQSPARAHPSTWPATVRCSIMCGCGTGSRSTTPSRRCRRFAPTTRFTIPMWTATPSTASTDRFCSPRASSISASCRMPARTGSTPRSSTPTATALVLSEVSKMTPDGLPVLMIDNAPPEIKTQSLQADPPGDLLRRSHARAGLRQHGAEGVQLSFGRAERLLEIRGQGRVSHLVVPHAAGRRHHRRPRPTSC